MSLRPIATSLQGLIGQTVTAPGYLVSIEFPGQTVRMSSRGTLAWGGETWVGYDLEVSGLASDGSGEVSGVLRVGNTDSALSALILGDGIAGRPVTIRVFYGDAPGADDVEEVFAGQGDEAGIDTRVAEIKLISDSIARVLLPRGRISPATGFNHLTPPGTVLTWNGGKIVLESANG